MDLKRADLKMTLVFSRVTEGVAEKARKTGRRRDCNKKREDRNKTVTPFPKNRKSVVEV
jgi:hypothetical protein